VSWHESDVFIRGNAETEMRFFLGLAAAVDALEVIFGLRASGSSLRSELSGTVGQLDAVELHVLPDQTAM
jgi:hypothetical protein